MARVPHRILLPVSLLVAGYAAVLFVASWLGRALAADVLLAIPGMAVFTTVGWLFKGIRSLRAEVIATADTAVRPEATGLWFRSDA